MPTLDGYPTEKCPFCGCKTHKIEALDSYGDNGYVVMCTNCGACGPNELNKNNAVAMWNMRREKMPNDND